MNLTQYLGQETFNSERHEPKATLSTGAVWGDIHRSIVDDLERFSEWFMALPEPKVGLTRRGKPPPRGAMSMFALEIDAAPFELGGHLCQPFPES